jgi:malonyl CoA-acyl carrier protein transacylase
MNTMWADGITTYCEMGPGKVLQGLVKRTLAEAVIDGVDTATDVARYNG